MSSRRPTVAPSSPEISVAASAPLETALEAVFGAVDGPPELDDVTGLLASAWGIRDTRLSLDAAGGRAASAPDPATVLDCRRRLERLWAGIAELPPPQRAALLLHLRDDGGGPVLHLLPASGVASLRRIAEVLDLEPAELAGLWNRLPLGDSDIAPRLRVNRQQVINLRSAARQRLTRLEQMAPAGAQRQGDGNNL
jgi:hypothetical protein